MNQCRRLHGGVTCGGVNVASLRHSSVARQRCRIQIEVRYRPGPLPSRQQACARSDRSHQSSDRRSRRNQPLSGQSAWLGHRPHQPASLRRGRLSQHRRRRSGDARSARGHRQYGLRLSFIRCRVEGDGQAREIEAAGVLLACKAWNNGFRQLTSTAREIHTPEDFKGFKMRVPAAPILTSLFQALGGSDAHQFQRTLFCVCKPGSSKARRTRSRSSRRPTS